MIDLKIVHQRGGIVEAEHPVSAVRCNVKGDVLDRIGMPFVTTWRSAAKPFQLEANLGALETSLVESLEDADLAVGAASHSAQPTHTDRVQMLLQRFGLLRDHLYCGAHWPIHEPTARAVARQSEDPAPIHNNCSGKHAYMAAASRSGDTDLDYRGADHPVQQAIRALIDIRTAPHGVQGIAVDGCGVPTFALELAGMATAWAQLAEAMEKREGLLGRIGWAMNAYPEIVSGEGRQDLAQIHGAQWPIVTKVGAVGLSCIAIPHCQEGVAVKIRSGDNESRAVAVQAVLNRWYEGLLLPGIASPWEVLHNWVGTETGNRESVWGDE